MLHCDVFLAAEAAADIGVLDLDLVIGQAQHRCRLVQGIVYGLVGGINEDMVVLHKGDCALRLQERMLIPRRVWCCCWR